MDRQLVVRFCRPGERYIFNVSGQSMDVTGIPVVCCATTDELLDCHTGKNQARRGLAMDSRVIASS